MVREIRVQSQARVLLKTKKMLLDSSLLNTQDYMVWIKSKWSNPGKGVTPFPTPIEKEAFGHPQKRSGNLLVSF